MRGIVPLIIISIFLSIAYYLYNSSLEYDKYSVILEEYRKERNDFLNNSSSSPLKGSEYKLSYYDPNVNFKVIAVVSQNEEPDTIKLATSTGNVERLENELESVEIYYTYIGSDNNQHAGHLKYIVN